MAFNPLEQKGIPVEKQLRNWKELNSKPVDKDAVDAYTRCRIIVMNGAEMEGMWFSHQFARHSADPDVKRYLAMGRRIESQQQKAAKTQVDVAAVQKKTSADVLATTAKTAAQVKAIDAKTEATKRAQEAKEQEAVEA